MFDMASQFLLLGRHTHGQGCGMDGNDGGSLERGLGSGLGQCGHHREACLEHGLGAEGHLQSAQRCISADQEEVLQDHGDRIQSHQGNERKRKVACGSPATCCDGFWGYVVEVHDQWSPAHEAQEEISKEGAHVSLARDQPAETPCLLRAIYPSFETW